MASYFIIGQNQFILFKQHLENITRWFQQMYIDLYKIVLVPRLISFLITYFFSTLRPADCARFGSTCTKIGMIQRRLAWPLCKDVAFLFHGDGLNPCLPYNVTNLCPQFIRHSVYQIQSLKSISHFHCIIIRDLSQVIPEWSSGFPYFLQFKSEFGNKEFMI